MTRHILSFTVVGFLVATVGAQGPKALTASQKADLFKKNRDVIEKVVTQTIDSSKSPNDPLKRAKSKCRTWPATIVSSAIVLGPPQCGQVFV